MLLHADATLHALAYHFTHAHIARIVRRRADVYLYVSIVLYCLALPLAMTCMYIDLIALLATKVTD